MRFGEYELLDRIAVGGMAEVFRGRAKGEEGFEKLVAIKRVLPSFARDARFVNMLLTEARIHAALSHRNIVQIHDLGISEEGEYFIVLEYVDGPDLGAMLSLLAQAARSGSSRPSRVPDAVALYVAIELGEGVHFAHELRGPDGQPLSLVHRDISPSNVLLSYAGEVKLADFGLAKRHTDHSVNGGSLKGKLAYMSPEQARRVPLDRRSDVFSLGAILFEMLTGRRLREIADDVSGWQQVASGLVPPPRRFRPDLPAALDRVLAGALAPDPRDRFAHARAFVEAARAALDLLPRSRVGEAGELQALLKDVLPPGSPRPRGSASKVIRLMPDMLPRPSPDAGFAEATVVSRGGSQVLAASMATTTVGPRPGPPDAASMAVTRVAPYPTSSNRPAPSAPQARPATPAPLTLYNRPAAEPPPEGASWSASPRPAPHAGLPVQQRSTTSPGLPVQQRPATSPGLPVQQRPATSPGLPVQQRPATSPGLPVQQRPATSPGLPVQQRPATSPGLPVQQRPATSPGLPVQQRSTTSPGLPVQQRPVTSPELPVRGNARSVTSSGLPVVAGGGAMPAGPPRHTPSGGLPALPRPGGSGTSPLPTVRRPTPSAPWADAGARDLPVVGVRGGRVEEIATTTLHSEQQRHRPMDKQGALGWPLFFGSITGLAAVVAGVHLFLVPLPVLGVWREPARLDVRSDPAGAEVYVDGRRLSALTPTYTEVRRDRRDHTVELRKDGFHTLKQPLRYDRTAELFVTAPLSPSARPGVEQIVRSPTAAAASPDAGGDAGADAGADASADDR